MQTFVPTTCFLTSLASLDDKRLGKQRVETLQIIRALRGETKGWREHPATRMWEGRVGALVVYGMVSCAVWRLRGFDDSCMDQFAEHATKIGALQPCLAVASMIASNANTTVAAQRAGLMSLPVWWGGPIHRSHRRSLAQRVPEHYEQAFGERGGDDEPLFWPVELKGPHDNPAWSLGLPADDFDDASLRTEAVA